MKLDIDRLRLSEDFEVLSWQIKVGLFVYFTDWELKGDHILSLYITIGDYDETVMSVYDPGTIQSFLNEAGRSTGVGELLRDKNQSKAG